MKYRIFVGVVGQAENMQVEPVLETQPTMENNIDDSMQIIFHKNNKETRDKGKEYIKNRQYIQGKYEKKNCLGPMQQEWWKKKEPENGTTFDSFTQS